ncbi:MAG: 3-deoxy-D-manno-octulosonic acid transferase [Gammaproteobacteria bacterium]|nr:lipid IV(A) 3-deoxy-D-manno-octulosonic acid transferase [Gammaproteobacteria bacterium]NNC97532.1 3-deoxy-D-manno-octulosonic acid transferase [Gammaproteobacteria bacterium]NNM14248.1 3-deoxy-D-manno-octulosonic acid transferase [Gammaproteobacteria bacterium]
MRFLLALLAYLLLPLMFFAMLWRGIRAPSYRKRFSERFGFYRFKSLQQSIWVHAVSVGEVQAAIPLIKRLQHTYPDETIVVTTQTPTGSERVKKVFGDSVVHCYVPYDVPIIVQRFFKHIKPRLALIMETEIWPHIYATCAKQKIPIIIASARISPRSIQSYLRFKVLFRETLNQATLIAAQTSRDAERFKMLGASEQIVSVVGNLKFDFMFVPSNVQEKGREYRNKYFSDRPSWIAASTHAGEEGLVLDVHKELLQSYPDLVLFLVPRHPDRFRQVESMLKRSGLEYCVRSKDEMPQATTAVMLIDTLGELPMFYAASDIAFVGGSLVPIGGHNLLEPAALSLPIVVGPHTFNAPEISEMLEEVGTLEMVSDQNELCEAVQKLLEDTELATLAGNAGREVIAENYGALDKLLNIVKNILN